MPTHKKTSFSRTIINIIMAVPVLFGFFSNFFSLLEYEAKLAGRTVILFLITGTLVAMLLTVTWLCLLGMLFVYFISLQLNIILALFIILLINIILIFILIMSLIRMKRNIFFPATMHLLHHTKENLGK